jgi:hypothetical protein
MATITWNTSGFFDVAGIWDLGIVPGDGDRVIGTAGLTCTLRDARTIGPSPTSADVTNWALDMPTSASAGAAGDAYFVFSGSAAQLTVKGPVRIQNTASRAVNLTAIDMSNGGTWTWDGTGDATSGGGATYRLQSGTATFNYRRIVMGNGAIMQSAAALGGATGTGCGYLTAGGGNGVPIDVTGYCKFSRVGDASNPCIVNAFQNSANTHWQITDAWFDHCGALGTNGSPIGASAAVKLQRVTMTNSAATTACKLGSTSGTNIVVDNCVFDKLFDTLNGGTGIKVTNCTFLGYINPSLSVKCTQWDDNLVYIVGSGTITATAPCDTMNREIRFVARNENNWHHLACIAAFNVTAVDGIIEPLSATTTDGEYFHNNTAATTGNNLIRGYVFLPYHDGVGSRWLEVNTGTAAAPNNSLITAEHCSGPAYFSSIGYGHSGNDLSGVERERAKSNLFVNFSSQVNCTKVGFITNDTTDEVLGSGADYNCGWAAAGKPALAAGRNGKGYNNLVTGALPGAHDVDVDPWAGTKPNGPTNRLSTFATSLGYAGTDAQKEDAMFAAFNVRLLNGTGFAADANYNAAVTHAAYYTYIRNDWAPTNPLLQGAAHDAGAPTSSAGTWIGAIQGVVTSGVTGVSVSPASTRVKPGDTVQLSATVLGTGSPSQSVTWSTSDASVATVSAGGLVTGVALGTCTITATSVADGSKTGTSSINVTLHHGLPWLPAVLRTAATASRRRV